MTRWIFALLLAVATTGAAHAASTVITGTQISVSPSQPAPGDLFTVSATLRGSTGSPCITTVTVSVAGLSQSRSGIRVHANQPARLSFQFDLTGISGGTDLTPTVRWTGCGNGSSSSISGGGTPPSVQAAPTSALSVQKSLSGAGKTIVSPGDVVTYRLEYASTGSAVAPSVQLTDVLDSRLSFVSATGGGTHSGGTVTWNFGDIAPGGSDIVEITARVNANAAPGPLDNVATISAAGAGPFDSNPVQLTIDTAPNIRLRKTIGDRVTEAAVLEAGRRIVYLISYENLGGGDADNVVITDVLPTELVGTPLLSGGDSNAYDPATRTATWDLGTVPRKATGTVTLYAQIDPALGRVDFDNTARATFDGGASNVALAHITVAAEPYLLLDKSVQPTLAAPGDALTYTIEYSNIGSLTAQQPVIRDTLPVGLTPIPGTFSGTYDPATRTLEWALPDLQPGNQAHSLSYRARIDSTTGNADLVNQVTATADNLPGVLTAFASAKVEVRETPVLAPRKRLVTGSSNTVFDGDLVTYEISVENLGAESTAGGITITDTLQPGLVFVSASSGGGETSPGVVTWNLADIPANGQSGVVTLQVRVDGTQLLDGDFITNAIEVTARDRFGRRYQKSSNHPIVQYNADPSVDLTKTASPPASTPVFPGDVIDYTITADLTSLQPINDLRITDLLPPELEFVKAGDLNVVTTTDASGTLIEFPPAILLSGSRTFTVQARVNPGVSPGTAITNNAFARFSNGSRFASTSLRHFVSDAEIRLQKTRPSDQAEVLPGEEISYRIQYENTGKIPLTGVQLRDTLPGDVTLVAAKPPVTRTVPGPQPVLEWDLPSLDAGASNTVTVQVRVANDPLVVGAVLDNQAEISSVEAQPKTASVRSVVRAAPVLTLSKDVSLATAHPGDSVEYTISYANTGKGDALNVVLTDRFPAALTFVSASDQVTPSGGTLTWNLGTLAAGDSGSKTVRAIAPAGAYVPAIDVSNRADIVSEKTSATAAASLRLTELPAFTLTKSADRTTVSPGDVIRYTLTLDKTGGAATDVGIVDLLSPDVRYVPGSGNLPLSAFSDIDAGFLAWELADFPAGPGSVSLFFDAKVADVLPNGTPLRNLAAIGSRESGSVLSNPVTTSVQSQPVLSIRKTASVATLLSPISASGVPGDRITYSITVENSGNANAIDVTVSDTLPAELEIDPGSTNASINGQTATWVLPLLTPGSPVTLTIAARVANDVPDGTKLRNSASAQTTMPGVGGAVSQPVTTIVEGQPRLTLSKQASANTVRAGEQLSYTLSYANEGTAASGTIMIEDLLPPQTRFVSASDGGMNSGSGHVTWSLPALQPGESGAVTLTVAVDQIVPNNTRLNNSASIWEGGNASRAVPASIVGKPAIVSSAPLLEIEKTVGKKLSRVTAGGTATFELAYRNVGSDTATNVVITDTLPQGLSLVSATGAPVVNGTTLTWTLPAMAARTAGSLLVTTAVDPGLANGVILTNSASITATEQPLSKTDSASVTVLNEVLTLDKSADRPVVKSGVSATGTPGDLLTYTLTYGNAGGLAASDVIVEDVLPGNVTFVSATPAPTSVSGQKVSWSLGSVAPQSQGQLLLVTRVGNDLRDGTVLHNTASIRSTTTAGTGAVPVDTLVSSRPRLAIDKRSTVNQVSPGQTYAYDITVSNLGADLAQDVVLTDTLPAETTFVSATGGGTHSGGVVRWDLGTLLPNTAVTVHVKVTANDVIVDGTPLLNVASVTGATASNVALAPVSASLLLPATSSPVLSISLTPDRTTVQPGDVLGYTVSVRNTGNDIATDVFVAALPPPDSTPQTIGNGGTFTNGLVLWPIGSLPPSGRIDLQFSVLINTGVADGTPEPSIAAIVASNAPSASAEVTTLVTAQPDLVLTKRAPDSVNAGEALSYTLDYFNQGNGAASGVVIEDNLPPGTTFVAADSGGAEVSPGVVHWNLGSVPPLSGGSVTVEVVAAAGPNDGAIITNVASISSAGTGSRTAQATTIERSHTELDVTITAGQDPVDAGGQEVLTITWGNSGNQDTANAVVTATVPPNTRFASATAGGTFNGTDLVTFRVGSLPAGASGAATITLDVDSPLPNGTILKSVAAISADSGQPDSASVPFMVSSAPVLVASKSASAPRVDPGGSVTFTVTVSNAGNAVANDVTVTDTLPAGLVLLGADSGAIIDRENNRATWNLGAIAPGAVPVSVKLTARMRAANATLVNVAEISSAETPTTTARASVEAGDLVPVPTLSVYAIWILTISMIIFAWHRIQRLRIRNGR